MFTMSSFIRNMSPTWLTGRRHRLLAVPTIVVVLARASVPGALAGQPVTQALNPPPPDFYTCSATGSGTICRASTVNSYDLEPTGILCGSGQNSFEVLDSATRQTSATRYYDRNGNLAKRVRVYQFTGARLTNPLSGATVAYHQHNTDWDVLAVPGDFGSDTWTGHGFLSINVPGYGVVIHEAGRTVVGPSGDVERQSGPSDLSDYYGGDTGVVADLCAALGG